MMYCRYAHPDLACCYSGLDSLVWRSRPITPEFIKYAVDALRNMQDIILDADEETYTYTKCANWCTP